MVDCMYTCVCKLKPSHYQNVMAFMELNDVCVKSKLSNEELGAFFMDDIK